MIFVSFGPVRKTQWVSSLGMRVSCFKKINCVPNCSLRELLVRKSHDGGLIGHFGVAKTLVVLQERFY